MFREFPNEFVEIAADLDAHGSACLKDLVGLVGADRVIESYRQSSAGVRDLVAEMNRYGGDFCREFVSTLTPAAVHAIFERDAGQLAGVIQAAGDAGLDPFRKTVALLAASLGAGPVTQALSEDPTVLEVALGKPMALYEDTFPLMVAELGQPAVADAFRSSPLDL